MTSWRITDPETTYQIIRENLSKFGLKRLVDITGLDVTGIPVYLCIRPRGRCFTVSAGKGLTHLDSKISALMESIEIDVAENVNPSEASSLSYNQLPLGCRIPRELMPAISTSLWKVETPSKWVKSMSLDTGALFYLPWECITMDIESLFGGLASFAWGTNGLASALNRQEAILSGLYEVIERDSVTCWSYYTKNKPSIRMFSVGISSIPFPSSINLINQVTSAGLNLFLIQLRNELDLPVFKCHILNGIDPGKATASGYGCHHSTEIAINRAITEAVQGRTCFIAGSREDILTTRFRGIDYGTAYNYFSNFIEEALIVDETSAMSTVTALESLLKKFAALGWHPPVIYDYPGSDPFKVVKVVCPSLSPISFSGMSLSHPRPSSFYPPTTRFQAFCQSLSL